MAARRPSIVDSNPTQIRLQKKRKISKFTILMISSPEIGVPVFREIKLNSKITFREEMNHHLRFFAHTVAATLMAITLKSCSTGPSTEDLAQPPLLSGEIRYSFHSFTTDETLDVTNSFPNPNRIAGIYSGDEGIKLLAIEDHFDSLNRLRSETNMLVGWKRRRKAERQRPINCFGK